MQLIVQFTIAKFHEKLFLAQKCGCSSNHNFCACRTNISGNIDDDNSHTGNHIGRIVRHML